MKTKRYKDVKTPSLLKIFKSWEYLNMIDLTLLSNSRDYIKPNNLGLNVIMLKRDSVGSIVSRVNWDFLRTIKRLRLWKWKIWNVISSLIIMSWKKEKIISPMEQILMNEMIHFNFLSFTAYPLLIYHLIKSI